MNRKQLTILLVLAAVLGGAGLMIRQRGQNDWLSSGKNIGQKLLGEFPINDVARIIIRTGSNELSLVRKDGTWRVHERGDYPANFQQISEFLIKAQELKVTQSETVGKSQLPRLALAVGEGTNQPTTVDFKDQAGKSIRSLVLGKKHMKKSAQASPMGEMGEDGWPDGRWVKTGDSDTVAVVSEAFVNIEPKPDQWLNKDFIHVDKIRSIAVSGPATTNAWKLTRQTEAGEWKLADPKPGEQLDNTKTSGLASSLASPSFNDIVVDAKPELLGLDKPSVITIETFDNFTYTLKTGAKTNDTYAVTLTVSAQLAKERTPGKDEKAEDKARLDKEFKEGLKKLQDKLAQEKTFETSTYLVNAWTFESILKDRSALLVEKKDEAKKDEKTPPGEIPITPPGVTLPPK